MTGRFWRMMKGSVIGRFWRIMKIVAWRVVRMLLVLELWRVVGTVSDFREALSHLCFLSQRRRCNRNHGSPLEVILHGIARFIIFLSERDWPGLGHAYMNLSQALAVRGQLYAVDQPVRQKQNEALTSEAGWIKTCLCFLTCLTSRNVRRLWTVICLC